MSEPIVFISHFTVNEGRLDDYRRLQVKIADQLRREKPRTLAYVNYLDGGGSRMTAIHVFADPEAMDIHFQGSEARSVRAFEVLRPAGWEIYGRPSAEVIDAMRAAATAAEVPLTLNGEFVAGFLRR